MTQPEKVPTAQAGIEPRIIRSRGGRLDHLASEAVYACRTELHTKKCVTELTQQALCWWFWKTSRSESHQRRRQLADVRWTQAGLRQGRPRQTEKQTLNRNVTWNGASAHASLKPLAVLQTDQCGCSSFPERLILQRLGDNVSLLRGSNV